MKNIWDLIVDQAGHHCPQPDCGALKRSCFVNLHVAFCCAPVEMENGSWRFCGCRFQVESPNGCAQHFFTQDGAVNKFFQKAKKGQPYELPHFPHEAPGWGMPVNGYGDVRSPLVVSMNKVKEELGFVAVFTFTRGQPELRTFELGRVPKWELMLTKDRDEELAKEKPKELTGLEKELADAKQKEDDGKLWQLAHPHTLWTNARQVHETAERWARKDAKSMAQTLPPTQTQIPTRTGVPNPQGRVAKKGKKGKKGKLIDPVLL